MSKKVIISGATGGIGRAFSQRLLAAGYQVVGLGRDHSKFTPTSANYFPYLIDFNHIQQLETDLFIIKKNHPDVEMLVCCAGYGQFAQLEQFSAAQIQQLMNVNFTSQAIFIKTFLPLLKQQRQGKIVVLGSEAALAGAKQGSIYCASKFALRGFCQSLRHECRSANIGVTLINPGLVRTAFFDQLHFSPGIDSQHALSIEDVIDAMWLVITAQPHCVLEEINLQPLHAQVRLKE